MFGCLLGTLRQFQQEETALKPKDEKRALIDKKVEEKSKMEKLILLGGRLDSLRGLNKW